MTITVIFGWCFAKTAGFIFARTFFFDTEFSWARPTVTPPDPLSTSVSKFVAMAAARSTTTNLPKCVNRKKSPLSRLFRIRYFNEQCRQPEGSQPTIRPSLKCAHRRLVSRLPGTISLTRGFKFVCAGRSREDSRCPRYILLAHQQGEVDFEGRENQLEPPIAWIGWRHRSRVLAAHRSECPFLSAADCPLGAVS